MASTLCTLSFSGFSSIGNIKTTMYSLPICYCSSSSTNSCLKTLKLPSFSRFSQMGLCNFTPWNGLKNMGISISAKPQKLGKTAKCRGKVVYASLFGVGAPEALVIGVVALLVFGPKGLAEVARNLGKTLRAFQPTIRELQDVSREFKSTLEREIGLDDDPRQPKYTSESNKANFTSNSSTPTSEESQTVPMADPNGSLSNKAYSSEDYLKITEEQLKAQQELMSPSESQAEPENQPEALQQGVMSSPPEAQIEPESQTQAVQQDVVSSSSENTIEPESPPQAAVQEMATAATSVEKPESES
ncbi:sec-independent protein translocase protein TATB, chloroplastic [Beta vulgaris subsp. vulgaris]|uniref:sec-independent protein translocase protein TATB, chloroplastic n=1 Tax=Beta vulgaris subsp. vulgaris TaxID=3555 RepID=UPI0020373308|nr:sec-independent protein translocase protein TATB, chloroplastic [Beta vulgaris subsp. vulgaris]